MAIPNATSELESEGAELLDAPAGHAAQRTFQTLGAVFLTLVVLQGSLFVPGVSRLLGLSVFDGTVVCILVISGATAATLAYRISGFSRLYLGAEYAESVLVAAAYSYTVYASGTPQSMFWVLYLAHVFVLGSTGTNLRNAVLLGLVPAALGLAFGLKGQLAGAVVSVVVGGFGVALYSMVGRSFDELEALRRREAELKGSLTRLRVRQERERIARDLHDGVGAQLAGLIWRVRGLASGSASLPASAELETVERRVLDTIDELRDVVLALRREPMSFEETTALIENRCQEMCGGVEFELRAGGAPDPATLDAVFPDLIRIVFELVRNAVRHAAPSRVEVQLESAGSLCVRISDDGRGFRPVDAAKSEGGLSNVRQRVEELSGHMNVESDARGTRIEILVPAPPSPSTTNANAVREPEAGAQALEIPASHAALRTVKGLAPLLLAVAAFVAALFVPAVARTLGVGPIDGVIAAGLTIIGATAATLAYRLSGPSRIYLWAEYGESVLAATGYSYLIHASGTAHSAFWFFYLFHCFGLAATGTSLRNSVLMGLAPAAVALGYVSQGQTATAMASLVAGAFGMMLYLTIAKAFDELEAARRREAKLKADLAELSVAKERGRIARDLHDSIGAQLTGLASRVRGFASGSKSPLGPAELASLERRVLDTIEELRDVVLALRRKPASVEAPEL